MNNLNKKMLLEQVKKLKEKLINKKPKKNIPKQKAKKQSKKPIKKAIVKKGTKKPTKKTTKKQGAQDSKMDIEEPKQKIKKEEKTQIYRIPTNYIQPQQQQAQQRAQQPQYPQPINYNIPRGNIDPNINASVSNKVLEQALTAENRIKKEIEDRAKMGEKMEDIKGEIKDIRDEMQGNISQIQQGNLIAFRNLKDIITSNMDVEDEDYYKDPRKPIKNRIYSRSPFKTPRPTQKIFDPNAIRGDIESVTEDEYFSPLPLHYEEEEEPKINIEDVTQEYKTMFEKIEQFMNLPVDMNLSNRERVKFNNLKRSINRFVTNFEIDPNTEPEFDMHILDNFLNMPISTVENKPSEEIVNKLNQLLQSPPKMEVEEIKEIPEVEEIKEIPEVEEIKEIPEISLKKEKEVEQQKEVGDDYLKIKLRQFDKLEKKEIEDIFNSLIQGEDRVITLAEDIVQNNMNRNQLLEKYKDKKMYNKIYSIVKNYPQSFDNIKVLLTNIYYNIQQSGPEKRNLTIKNFLKLEPYLQGKVKIEQESIPQQIPIIESESLPSPIPSFATPLTQEIEKPIEEKKPAPRITKGKLGIAKGYLDDLISRTSTSDISSILQSNISDFERIKGDVPSEKNPKTIEYLKKFGASKDFYNKYLIGYDISKEVLNPEYMIFGNNLDVSAAISSTSKPNISIPNSLTDEMIRRVYSRENPTAFKQYETAMTFIKMYNGLTNEQALMKITQMTGVVKPQLKVFEEAKTNTNQFIRELSDLPKQPPSLNKINIIKKYIGK